MLEIGRFRHGDRVFCGNIDAGCVTERDVAGQPATIDLARRWDYGELVVLCPTEPAHIIEATQTPSGARFRLRPPASLGPHRAMVAVPRGHKPITVWPRIGYVVQSALDRASVDQASDAILGYVTAIVFQDDTLFLEDPNSPASIAHEGFTTLGAAIAPLDGRPLGHASLWHNGREIPSGDPARPTLIPGTLLAGISAWIRLSPGDLVLVGGEQGSVRVRPGDHLECRCSPLRTAAVNIGLRGSA